MSQPFPRYLRAVSSAASAVIQLRSGVADSRADVGRLNPGLLAHLPDQCAAEGLALLDLAARKRPGAPGPGVLVQQQDLVILDDDSGNPDIHSPNLPRDGSR